MRLGYPIGLVPHLRAHPAREVRIGARRFRAPGQRFLNPEETAKLILDYRDATPGAWRRLAPILGLPLDPVQAEAAVRDIPAIAFSPADATTRPEPMLTSR